MNDAPEIRAGAAAAVSPNSSYSRQLARIVTFRVSDEQFERLVRASIDTRARSLSAFARDAALDKALQARTPPMNLAGDLASLTKALAELDASLREASDQIRRLLGTAGGANGPVSAGVGDE